MAQAIRITPVDDSHDAPHEYIIGSKILAEAALQAMLESLPECYKCADLCILQTYVKTLEGYREMWEQLIGMKKRR